MIFELDLSYKYIPHVTFSLKKSLFLFDDHSAQLSNDIFWDLFNSKAVVKTIALCLYVLF